MKKIFLLLLMILMVSGCGGESQDKSPAEPEKKSVEKAPASSADKKFSSSTSRERVKNTLSAG